MRETSDRIIKLAFTKNINITSSQHSIAIDKNSDIKVKNMFKDN